MTLSRLAAAVPTPDDTAWYDVIGKFKSAVAKFQAEYATLQSINIDPVKYPDLSKMQLDLLRSGNTIKETIRSITGAVDSAWSWIKSTFGFDGLHQMAQINGLGIAPLIPIAVVVGAVAAMVKWGLEFAAFYMKLEYAKSLAAQGLSPVQINEAMKAQESSKPLFDFSGISKVAMFGIAGFIGYQVWKNWK